MKNLITILILFLSLISYGQNYFNTDTAQVGQTVFLREGSNTISFTVDETTPITSKNGAIICNDVDIAYTSTELTNLLTTVQAGDAIGLVCDSSYIGEFTVSTDSISIFAVGNGELPTIKGTKTIEGWTYSSGSIWKKKLNYLPTQIFVNGVRANFSRYPESSYLFIDEITSTTEFSVSELNGTDWTGATTILRFASWSYQAKIITATTDSFITIESAPTYTALVGDPFYIINHLSVLNDAMECVIDPTDSTVYLWTPNGDTPDNYTIEGSAYINGFIADAVKGVTIQNVRFEGYQENAIKLTGVCSDWKIRSNDFDSNYECAVSAFDNDNTSNILIHNNYITGSNRCGIRVKGDNFTITDNVIDSISLDENIGLTAFVDSYNSGISIFGYPITNSVIAYNQISDIGYIGIMFYGVNNLIHYNQINVFCESIQDGGGIYTHMVSSGSIIEKNIVSHDIAEGFQGVICIYLDAVVTGVDVVDNTCFGASYGIFCNNLVSCNISGNTLFNNDNSQFGHSEYNAATNATDTINGNILYALTNDQYTVMYRMEDANVLEGLSVFDNFYASPMNAVNISVEGGGTYSVPVFQNKTAEGNGAQELANFSYDYNVTDTLTTNYSPDGTFDTSTTGWYTNGGVWDNTQLDTGCVKCTLSATSHLLQSHNLSITVPSEKKYLISFDVISPDTALTGIVTIGPDELGRYAAGAIRSHYQYLYTTSDDITGRVGLRAYGAIDDVIYYDNISVTEVIATNIDITTTNRLLYNDSKFTKTFYLNGAIAEDIYETEIPTSFTIPPFESKIVRGSDLNLISETEAD